MSDAYIPLILIGSGLLYYTAKVAYRFYFKRIDKATMEKFKDL